MTTQTTLNLKPTHQPVKLFYRDLQTARQLELFSEGSVSPHFAALLRVCAPSRVYGHMHFPKT